MIEDSSSEEDEEIRVSRIVYEKSFLIGCEKFRHLFPFASQ